MTNIQSKIEKLKKCTDPYNQYDAKYFAKEWEERQDEIRTFDLDLYSCWILCYKDITDQPYKALGDSVNEYWKDQFDEDVLDFNNSRLLLSYSGALPLIRFLYDGEYWIGTCIDFELTFCQAFGESLGELMTAHMLYEICTEEEYNQNK